MESDAHDIDGGQRDTAENGFDFDLAALPALRRALEGLQVTAATVRWPEPEGPSVLRVEFASEGDDDALAGAVVRAIQPRADTGGADAAVEVTGNGVRVRLRRLSATTSVE